MSREYVGIIVDDLDGSITAELVNGNAPSGWVNISISVQADDTGDFVQSTIDVSPATATALTGLPDSWQSVPAIVAIAGS